MRKYPFFRQMDLMDCGPACLKMVGAYYGRYFDLSEVRDLCYANKTGVTLLGIYSAARALGFRSSGVKTSFENLVKGGIFPCIVFWKQRHFVVVYKMKARRVKGGWKGHVIVGDPAFGVIRYTLKEFREGWETVGEENQKKGVALLLVPAAGWRERCEKERKQGLGLVYFGKYVRPHVKLLTGVVVGMGLGLVVQLIFPFITQAVVDVGVGNSDLNFVMLLLIAQLILSLSLLATDFTRNRILLYVTTRVNIDLVADFITKMLRLPIRFFDSKNTGDIMQRMEDHQRIQSFFTVSTIDVLFSFMSFLVFSSVLGYYNLFILLFFLAGHVVYAGWVVLFLKKRRELDFRRFDEAAKNQSNVIQIIEGAEAIKLNGCEQKMRRKWENVQAELFEISIKGLSLEQVQNAGAFFISNTVNICLFVYAAQLVITGSITLGMMMSLTYIIGQLKGPVQNFIGVVHGYQDARLSMERLREVHLRKDEGELNEGKREVLPDTDKSIYIENLSFSYLGPDAIPILKDLNLCFEYNKTTAIVGESGSGKTTLVKLLLGYYTPQQGCIRVGTVDLQDIHSDRWRERCAAVMQEGFLFSDTIAQNIGIKDETIDPERLHYAAKLANIDEFVEGLPKKYETPIGMEGNGLSQGQKQRILIARAIYRNPEFLFFDEATNALDTLTERKVQECLNLFFHGRTVVVVAHRLSTVRNADKIVVLRHGRVAEEGTHQELVAKKGYYYELVRNQIELG